MNKFKLQSDFKPRGDQKKAIKELVGGYSKHPQQTLLGVTGSGKTFTMANVIAELNKPVLVLSHNKTLAAQLYNEFKYFFPENKVCYFVSYYDYYQPESYVPETDTYIEKDVLINEKIEQLRLEAASALLNRKDAIVVSSVSCIYGLGSPEDYSNASFKISKGQNITPKKLAEALVEIQYERNDMEVRSGNFRIKGDILEFRPGSGASIVRVEFFGDKIEKIIELEPITYNKKGQRDEVLIFPAKHFMIPEDSLQRAVKNIKKELKKTLPKLGQVEAYRLQQRTNYDLEMLEEIGYCKGIENYSRHFDNRLPGEPPSTLLDFFPKDFLFFIDESHVTLPQVQGMYGGDRTRKKHLIENGFRLPSAYDNRPLKFSEFEKYLKNVIYASATPGDYELDNSGQIVEQIIRPTGLVDPPIEIKPSEGQVKDVIKEIQATVDKGYRVLVTTLTKRLAEDLTTYLVSENIKTQYLHSEIDTLERSKIINNLRLGKFDVLVGINLLREGLDIPEVALVAILDADKEGFLRNTRSLIQTIGRAARNVDSKVVMYADEMTKSIKEAVKETERRRRKQLAYNKKHNINPKTIKKAVIEEEEALTEELSAKELDKNKLIIKLETEMKLAAENLDFEKAIELREKLKKLKKD